MSPPWGIIHISAKTGQGVDRLLDGIVQRIPPPRGSVDDPPRALIFDSIYDQYRGVVAFLRVVDEGFTGDTCSERLFPFLGARDLQGTGLWLPVWVLWSVAHGNSAGEVGAGVL